MQCSKLVNWKCSRGHSLTTPCFKGTDTCQRCIKEDKAAELKRQRDFKLDTERQRRQNEYAQKLSEALDEIARIKQIQRDSLDYAEQQRILNQHRQEIETLKSLKPGNSPQTVNDDHGKYEQGSISANQVIQQGSSAGSLSTFAVDTPGIEISDTEDTTSPTRDDWEYQKTFLNAQSTELDSLMEMIGLETVKEKFLAIKAKVDLAVSQNIRLDQERFGTVFVGNPGTGKTTVARLYAKFLASMGVIPGTEFVETTGSKLASSGIAGCQKIIDSILKNSGGVLFIDEAYQLVGNSSGGKDVLEFLLGEVEGLMGKIVFILAGYQAPMEKLLAQNVGLLSRFPHELKFKDYEDEELLQILGRGIQRRWRQQANVENGLNGLYCRIVSRRVGRGRGTEGFGNARAIENIIAKISERQSARLKKATRHSKDQVDKFLLTKEDLIGPEPSQAIQHSKAWKTLDAMIGLDSVKESVRGLMDTIKWNYQRELDEKSPIEYTLNKVFLGSPGTGKTTVAKLYGQILVDIGMLSNGEGKSH